MNPYRIVVDVPVRTLSELNRREHFRQTDARRRQQHAIVTLLLRRHRAPKPPLLITMTRRSPGVLDNDNAESAMKFVRDAIANWLGTDDGDPDLVWVVEQERSEDYSVRIRVEATDRERAFHALVENAKKKVEAMR